MSKPILRFDFGPCISTFVAFRPAQQLKALSFVLDALQNSYLAKLNKKEHRKFDRIMEPVLRTAHEMMDNPDFIADKPGNYTAGQILEKAMKYFYGDKKIPKAARKIQRSKTPEKK